MNIFAYNFHKLRIARKLKTKDMAKILRIDRSLVRKYEQGRKYPDNNTLAKIQKTFDLPEEFTTQINETIDLRAKKIYGVDYLFIKYSIQDYQKHYTNHLSAGADLFFVIVLLITYLLKSLPLSSHVDGFLKVLQTIFIIEVFVLPFMFIVIPLLKIYFNRTYQARLESNLKEEDQEEACAIIYSCLLKDVHKAIILHFFTIFSELVICLFCLLYMLENQATWGIITLLIVGFIAIIGSLICYIENKKSQVLRKG